MARADSSQVSGVGFELAGGSIPGADHLRAARNRQDAFAWAKTPQGLVAVVADGCGSGAHSELGALLATRLLVTGLAGLLGLGLDPETLLETARRDLLARLRLLAGALALEPDRVHAASPPAGLSRTVREHLLFTLVGAFVCQGELVSFALGDGLLVLNGDPRTLGPFPGNQPPYLGYALLRGPADPEVDRALAFRIHHRVPIDEVRSLLLGTDGVADLMARDPEPLARFWTQDRYFKNPDLVRRELTLAQRRLGGRALADDTTLVVLRRREAS